MFSARPEDIAKFREVTHSNRPGISPYVTFRCKRCKDDHRIEHRRRAGSHIKDGFICVHCKERQMRYAKLNNTGLAED